MVDYGAVEDHMIDFTKPVLFDAPNNGYMVTLDNGWPYEVLADDPLMAQVTAWLAAGNTAADYSPTLTATPQSLAQLAAAQQAQLASDQWAAIQQGLLALANGAGTDPLSVALQGFIKVVTS
jgi:hypothetical protein